MINQSVIFACGGTGGHVFPAVALANNFEERGFATGFFGRADSMEETLVSRDFTFYPINAVPLKRALTIENFFMVFRLILCVMKAYKLLKKVKPGLVIGTGGYVSLPTLLAAKLCKIPVYIQEQNSVLGVANKIGNKFAKKVFLASKNTIGIALSNRVLHSGNPIRTLDASEMNGLPDGFQKFEGKKLILVIGGSQGAKGINEKLEEQIEYIEKQDKFALYWQVGKRNEDLFKAKYPDVKNIEFTGFINNILHYMKTCDLVISRAGASSISEILTIGKASILVPFPFATANHQEHNARDLEKGGAALVELENESNEIIQKIESLIDDPETIKIMENNAIKLSMPKATEYIVDQILETEGVK